MHTGAAPPEQEALFRVHSWLDSVERGKLVAYLSGFLLSVFFLQVDVALLQGFPESAHGKFPSFCRLLLPEILPTVVDRVIYLHSDLVVNGSLDHLWTMPLDGHFPAAASDRNLHMQRARLALDCTSPYFIAGVTTLELSKWRPLHVASRGLVFAKKHTEKLANGDQDVLNRA